MDLKKAYLKFEGYDYGVQVRLPDICPICHKGIYPKFIYGEVIVYEGARYGIAFYWCPNCGEIFAAKYFFRDTSKSPVAYGKTAKVISNYATGEIQSITPHKPKPCVIPVNIETISPDFKNIYQQAKWAKEYNLIDICGISFRKALEFLIKDYCINKSPIDESTIKKMNLAKCIENYIDSSKIKTLASRSAWLGNDEAHYERLHEERNFEDLEKFIDAIIAYIDMELTVEDAESIEFKK